MKIFLVDVIKVVNDANSLQEFNDYYLKEVFIWQFSWILLIFQRVFHQIDFLSWEKKFEIFQILFCVIYSALGIICYYNVYGFSYMGRAGDCFVMCCVAR